MPPRHSAFCPEAGFGNVSHHLVIAEGRGSHVWDVSGAMLEPNLEAVELPVRKQLHPRNKRIMHVYFPESGIASVVTNGEHAFEIGIIEREGVTGVPIVMGSTERPQHDTYIQVAGTGQRLSADLSREAIRASVTLHQSLLDYAYKFMTQMADTALSNGRHKIEERLARWLLLADDRLDNHEIPLTHEFLGVMLGTATPGVTIALLELNAGDGLPTNDRIIVHGPSVALPANSSLMLTMCLHELATNAAKDGALSNGSGQVHVAWELVRNGSDHKVKLNQDRAEPFALGRSHRWPAALPPTRQMGCPACWRPR